jgi:hypothetical protein
MGKLKYEEKFIVINKKHLRDIPDIIRTGFLRSLEEIKSYIPENKYYVCNQDEPYADKIIDIILQGDTLEDNSSGLVALNLSLIREKQQAIFDYFAENHNLTLTHTDIDDIENLFNNLNGGEK